MGKKKPVISFNSTSITEGDSLITTLINLKPRKKFFYALTGDSVDKNDLDSGEVKGRLKASKQGTAVLSHLFSEDNFKEGTETFTLSIFKDKKNRKLLGESQLITLGESTTANTNGDLKNKFHGVVNGTKIYPRKIYDQDSNLPGKNMLGEEFKLEYELGEDAIVGTVARTSQIRDGNTEYQRIALLGEFEYDQNGEFQGGEVREIGNRDYEINLDNEFQSEHEAVDYNSSGPISISPNLLFVWTTIKSMQDRVCQYGKSKSDGVTIGDGKNYDTMPCAAGYPASIYFEDNWWENPFAPDVI